MDYRACSFVTSLVMECPSPSSSKILSPENCNLVSGKALDGRDGLLGCLAVTPCTDILCEVNTG